MAENEREREALLSDLKMKETRPSLRENREIAGDKTWVNNENSYPKREKIRDEAQEIIRDGQREKALRYEKRWDYHTVKDAKGQDHDTENIKSISETAIEYSDDGLTQTTHGNHLMREHVWMVTEKFDQQGRLLERHGETTAGVEKGNTWNETDERRQVGNYTETVKINTAAKQDATGAMVEVRTVTILYHDTQGQSVWGEKQSQGKPDTYHTWGIEPADLPKDGRRNFQELLAQGQAGE